MKVSGRYYKLGNTQRTCR